MEVKLLNVNPYHGFPVVREEVLIGYVTRDRIKVAISERAIFFQSHCQYLRASAGLHQSEIPTSNIKRCVFSKAQGTDVDVVDMTDTLDQGFMQLRKEVSQEFAVNMFQKLASIQSPESVYFKVLNWFLEFDRYSFYE